MVIFQGANLHRLRKTVELWLSSELAVFCFVSIILRQVSCPAVRTEPAIYTRILFAFREARDLFKSRKLLAQGQRCYSTAKIAIKADGWIWRKGLAWPLSITNTNWQHFNNSWWNHYRATTTLPNLVLILRAGRFGLERYGEPGEVWLGKSDKC